MPVQPEVETHPVLGRVYGVNEVFYSLQGEGARAGSANIFIRFQHCNLRCIRDRQGFDCDTDFVSGNRMSEDLLVAMAERFGRGCKNIIFTGGEPTLQLNPGLVSRLKNDGYYLAIETNGTRTVPPGIDWITVSPKTAEHTLRQLHANEVKYVRALGQAIPQPTVKADHYFISPAFDGTELDDETLKWCMSLVKENPKWRLSVQQHKLWAVR